MGKLRQNVDSHFCGTTTANCSLAAATHCFHLHMCSLDRYHFEAHQNRQLLSAKQKEKNQLKQMFLQNRWLSGLKTQTKNSIFIMEYSSLTPFKYPCPPVASRQSCIASRTAHVQTGLIADDNAWISLPTYGTTSPVKKLFENSVNVSVNHMVNTFWTIAVERCGNNRYCWLWYSKIGSSSTASSSLNCVRLAEYRMAIDIALTK